MLLLFVCVYVFVRSLHEEMRSLEESRRQQIHQLKKQEEHCHMQRGEKRVMEGLRQDLIMKKDSTSTEIRVILWVFVQLITGVILSPALLKF